jgi:lysophospholipase L1-like esterase
MQGIGDSAGGFFRRVESTLTATSSSRRFLNMGIGGNTTRDMLARMQDVTQCGAHNLIVMLGCNDVPRDNDRSPAIRTTPAEYRDNLRLLLPAIQGTRSLFISSFPVCATRTGVHDETLAAYMQIALNMAAENGYDTWDLYGELKGTGLSPWWAPDGLHFNNDGHAMIASGVEARILGWGITPLPFQGEGVAIPMAGGEVMAPAPWKGEE